MTIFRAMVSFPGRTNVAEDVFINTFHLDADAADHVSVGNTLATDLLQFYTVLPPGGTNILQTYLSGFIGGTVTIKTYDLADAEPRIPHTSTFSIVPGKASNANLPNEVAVAISYRSTPPVTARRRGRFFFGPLNVFTLEGSIGPNQNTETRPSLTFIADLQKALTRFLTTSSGAKWVVYSAGARDNSDKDVPYLERDLLDPTYAAVVAGWIDNAFDTQRRRGTVATTKTLW